MLVPPANYAYEEIRPLNSLEEIKNFKENLEGLIQLSVASELLLAAQHNKKGIQLHIVSTCCTVSITLNRSGTVNYQISFIITQERSFHYFDI